MPPRSRWLKALKRNAKVYDDNELVVAAVNKGSVATGLIDHYYWYRLRDEVGAASTHSALHYFAPRDPGMLVDVSGAAILTLQQARCRRPALPRVPGQQAGADDHRDVRELRVPARLGRRRRARSRARCSTIVPARVSSAQLGDGKAALGDAAAGRAALDRERAERDRLGNRCVGGGAPRSRAAVAARAADRRRAAPAARVRRRAGVERRLDEGAAPPAPAARRRAPAQHASSWS